MTHACLAGPYRAKYGTGRRIISVRGFLDDQQRRNVTGSYADGIALLDDFVKRQICRNSIVCISSRKLSIAVSDNNRRIDWNLFFSPVPIMEHPDDGPVATKTPAPLPADVVEAAKGNGEIVDAFEFIQGSVNLSQLKVHDDRLVELANVASDIAVGQVKEYFRTSGVTHQSNFKEMALDAVRECVVYIYVKQKYGHLEERFTIEVHDADFNPENSTAEITELNIINSRLT